MDGYGDHECSAGEFCGNPLDYGISLEDDGVRSDAAIQYGISSFDHFGQSILAIFQIITQDSWTTIMFNVSRSPYSLS